MVFGDKSRLALECQDSSNPSRFQLGHICLWASERRIGAFEDTVDLGVPAQHFRHLLSSTGSRHDGQLSALGPEAALMLVENSLYGDHIGSLSESVEMENRYRRFCICPGGGEAFDGEFVILIETTDRERFIWREAGTGIVHEVSLPLGEFGLVVTSFLTYL
jgi:hypothetical protein